MNQPGKDQEYRSGIALVSDGDDAGSVEEVYAGADLFAAPAAAAESEADLPDADLPDEVAPGVRPARRTRAFGKHHGASDWFFFSKH